MNSFYVTLIGFAAAAFTTFGFVPQFLKIVKTKTTKGLSLLMMLQISMGLTLWIIYGLLRKDIVLITANSVGLSILFATLIVYFKYSKSE